MEVSQWWSAATGVILAYAPEALWKLAGGEAQRNHRYRPIYASRPERALERY